jgi:glycosyltransferase involved in cell wall biosynthesis
VGWGAVAPVGNGVRFLGFVPPADLPALYAASTVFAYPSLQEGYGMPVVEAMAQGTPVVTSRGSATEEVAGGAALLVDPRDPESIADGIDRAAADRDRLVAAGRARAATLSWGRSADLTVAAYREVAG